MVSDSSSAGGYCFFFSVVGDWVFDFFWRSLTGSDVLTCLEIFVSCFGRVPVGVWLSCGYDFVDCLFSRVVLE